MIFFFKHRYLPLREPRFFNVFCFKVSPIVQIAPGKGLWPWSKTWGCRFFFLSGVQNPYFWGSKKYKVAQKIQGVLEHVRLGSNFTIVFSLLKDIAKYDCPTQLQLGDMKVQSWRFTKLKLLEFWVQTSQNFQSFISPEPVSYTNLTLPTILRV